MADEVNQPEDAGRDQAADAPDYQYVKRLVDARARVYGGGAGRIGAAGTTEEDQAIGGGSVRTGRYPGRGPGLETVVREIRLRRQMRIDPIIPRNYRKTSRVVRMGQSLLADLALRLPAVLAAKPMQVRAQPLDDEDDSQAAATKKEEWTHAVLLGQEGARGVLDSGRTSVWRLWMDNLVNASRGVFLVQAREDRWSVAAPGFPDRAHYADDGDDVPAPRRRSGDRKWRSAIERFRRQHFPFVLESVDPLAVWVEEDEDGVDDEAVVIVKRPYRQTLAEYGLKPAGQGEHGPDVYEGVAGKYRAGPRGLGKPYAPTDLPIAARTPDAVETVTYYGSARRAFDLGLTDGSDPDRGVWAHYVDGVLVDAGPLLGPHWHPLPIFRAVGLPTAMQDPTYEGISALMHLIELADVLDEIGTMERHVSYWSAWPPIVEEDASAGGVGATGLGGDVVIDPERNQRPGGPVRAERRTIEPAGFYKVPTGRRWRYLTLPPESSAHLERLYQKARELFDLLGVPGVFRGAGGPSQAGYAISQLLIAAKSMYDPVLDNSQAAARLAVQYLWWQVWKRFPEGVAVYVGGDPRKDKKGGWTTLTPQDIAPDCKPNTCGQGTPFLACTVKADPLLPVDEAQMEQRGLNALQGQVYDLDTVRERYFADPAPEKTAARVLADKVLLNPIVQTGLELRSMVQQKLLLPEMAPLVYAQTVGVPEEMAVKQLALIQALTPEMVARIEALKALEAQQAAAAQAQAQAQQQGLAAAAAGQTLPGQQPVPGTPGLPGQVQTAPGVGRTGPPAPQGGPPILTGARPAEGPGPPLNQGGQPQAQRAA